MRKIISAAVQFAAAVTVISCSGGTDLTYPKMEIAVSEISSTGISVEVNLEDGATGYRMAVVPVGSFDSKEMEQNLSEGPVYTPEKRRIERLHGAKDFIVAARPYNEKGLLGEMVSSQVTLGEMDLEITLYTPGDSLGVELNRYNTLKVIATSNGIADSGRCAIALSSMWAPLKDSKGLSAAAEEVFSTNAIELTRQQLEEMADPNPLKRDIMYFNDLSDGTEYTLVVCLKDLDGESYYYSFNGATKRLNR